MVEPACEVNEKDTREKIKLDSDEGSFAEED